MDTSPPSEPVVSGSRGVVATEAQPRPAASIRLTVVVTELRSHAGEVGVALFDRASGFPEREAAFVSRRVSAAPLEPELTFDGLPPGRYALALHHDENGNGEMDSGMFGIPLEGFAFSNDAVVRFGPPSFDAAAFSLVDVPRREKLRMTYF